MLSTRSRCLFASCLECCLWYQWSITDEASWPWTSWSTHRYCPTGVHLSYLISLSSILQLQLRIRHAIVWWACLQCLFLMLEGRVVAIVSLETLWTDVLNAWNAFCQIDVECLSYNDLLSNKKSCLSSDNFLLFCESSNS